MSKSTGNTVMRFAAPGFSSSSTKTEKAIFNPGGIGTGDDITETGHKTWFGSEQEEGGAASEAMLGTPPGPESFATRPQNTQQRYRAGGLAGGDGESDTDKLGAPKKRSASRAILG